MLPKSCIFEHPRVQTKPEKVGQPCEIKSETFKTDNETPVVDPQVLADRQKASQ